MPPRKRCVMSTPKMPELEKQLIHARRMPCYVFKHKHLVSQFPFPPHPICENIQANCVLWNNNIPVIPRVQIILRLIICCNNNKCSVESNSVYSVLLFCHIFDHIYYNFDAIYLYIKLNS